MDNGKVNPDLVAAFEQLTNPESDAYTSGMGEKIAPDQRKISLSEYMASPEFQRKQKVEKETAERAEFQRRVKFREAQKNNPIGPRVRKKRGRKFRKRRG